jgi:hypothetical protein
MQWTTTTVIAVAIFKVLFYPYCSFSYFNDAIGVGISGTRYVDIAHVLSEVELIDLSNLMSDYSFLICTQSVPNIDSQSLY